jgi:outer membrane protein
VFNINKMIIAASAAVLVSLSGMANAEGKIAVIDVQRAISNSDVAKARIEAFSAQPDVKETIATLEALKADGQKMVEKLRAEEAILSAEQKAELQKKIQGVQSDMQYEGKKLQQANTELEQAIMRELNPYIGKIIDEIVQQEGIGLLLNNNPQIVLFSDTSYDITPKVTERLNKQK